MPSRSTHTLQDALAAGWTVVGATDRLARDLRSRHSLQQRAAGKKGWLAPDIPSLRHWISSSWLSTWPTEQVLHSAQELSLWLYAVETSACGDSILNKTGAARAARSAWKMAERHGISLEMMQRPHPGDDESAFVQWRQIVANKEIERGWITQDGIIWKLAEAVASGAWKAPPRIMVVGLLEPTGAQKHLFDAIMNSGSKVQFVDVLEPASAKLHLHRPETPLEQYRQLAVYFRERLLSVKDPNDTPRMAVLVPDANEARPMIEAILREYVSPQTSLPGANAGRRPWRYARGDVLSDHPMIATALDVLAVRGGISDLQTFSRVLLTPWLFGNFKASHRAAMDLALRNAGGTRFSQRRVLSIAQHQRDADPDNAFAAKLIDWIEKAERMPASALPSEWAQCWGRILERAGWGAREDSPADIKNAADAWAEAMDAFRAMDSQVREIAPGRAMVWLREVLAEKSVQASVDYLQPIYVLSYDDVNGMVFDTIAVCDANAHRLPAPVRQSGFISGDVLRKAGVLEATPEGALERGRRWAAHLQTLAPDVHVFAPYRDERGSHLDPSTLFEGWANASNLPKHPQSQFDLIVALGVQPVLPESDPVAAVRDPVAEGIRGGSRILTDMIHSPFVAFARARLGMEEFPSLVDGVDSKTQGIATHRALELIWKELKTSEALKRLSANAMQELIVASVRTACTESDRISEARFGKGLALAEERRLATLCSDWLRVERLRAHDFRALRLEAGATALIAGLTIHLKLDRIDEITLPDGDKRFLVIDYKTTGSKPLSANAWKADAMQEPQLPLYASCASLLGQRIERVDGIAFAQVHADYNKFVCATNFCDLLIPDTKGQLGSGEDNWDRTLKDWKDACEALVHAFMAGDISLRRESFEKSNQGKALAPLVRSAESEGEEVDA